MPRTLTVLGIDPGLTTGWSLNRNNEELAKGDVHFKDVCEFILSFPRQDKLDALVIEDFALLGSKAIAQTGSKFETCQVIGMFKLWAYGAGTPVIMQPPNIKPLAEKFSGRSPKGAHKLSHVVDAYNHAIYYLKRNDCYETEFEREVRERNEAG